MFAASAELTRGELTRTARVTAKVERAPLEGYAKLSYELLKRRDYELTVNERLDAANEEIESLLLMPALPLSEDRVRALRTGADGIWRLREYGSTVIYGANYSRGLDALGARTAADATPLLPLSRQGADAVFNKLDGHIEIDQSLPQDFFANFYAAGQDSFHRAMLTSEQYDVDGAKLLSGFTAGSLPGDTAWVMRGEFGRSFTTQLPAGGVAWMPYVFSATGERILEDPTVLEIASLHATKRRSPLQSDPALRPDARRLRLVEVSRRYTNEPILNATAFLPGC